MKFTFACKKVALNDSIKEYAEKKISKLDRYFPEEADAFVTFAVEKKNRCVVELTIRAANGTLFRAQEEDPDGDMRGAIDEAVAFIDRRIRKNKTRLARNLRRRQAAERVSAGRDGKRDAPAGVPSMVLRSLWGNYWFCSGLSSSSRVLAEAAKPASP